ncbi:MAG TPA: DUF4159 domain-containing protein [Bryobacteraceae bacterium]|jgi:hypothetical protein
MRFRILAMIALMAGLGAWGVLRAQKPFKEYPGREYTNFPLPSDYQDKTDWTRARLRYRNYSGNILGGGGFGRRGGAGSWTTDYPRSDRHLLQGVKRLTLIDTRSVEQVVDVDGDDDIYNWPMLYAVEVGHWEFNDKEAKQLREFLDRGGFLMVDDFHGTREWEVFREGIEKVFPDADSRIVDIPNSDAIFHTLYDLDDRFQVPGAQVFRSGRTYEQDGYNAEWKGIYDPKGRLVVAICHNMDLGDAWEWSDDPAYSEKWASLAYRIAMNYFVYDLSH